MKPTFFGKFAAPAIVAAILLAAASGAGAQTLGASNLDELVNAVESYKTAAADVVIIVTGSIAVNSTVFVNGNAGGRTLTIKGSSPFSVPALTRDAGFGNVMLAVFDPAGGAKLVLENIVIDGLGLGAAGSLVSVMRGCAFTMGAGAVLRGNAAPNSGVSVSEGGSFTMNGGEISGNSVSGVPYGGGVSVSGGSFVMNGGKIVNNAAGGANGAYGGGVSISGGSFAMKGGEISGNSVSNGLGGGGVYAHDCEFTMTGGAISGNSVSAASGGGVYVSSGSFTMTGGEAAGNTAGTNGGGVYISHTAGAFTLGGAAKIYGNRNSAGASSNIYLADGKYIVLQTSRSGLNAGVYTETAGGVIVQSGAASGDENRLFADQNDKRVAISESRLIISDDNRPSFANADVTVTQTNTPLAYTGNSLTPDFDVVYNGKKLVKDTDYKLEVAPQTGVGQYNTAVIRGTGSGPCKGEITGLTWIISKAAPRISSWPRPSQTSIPYGTRLFDVQLNGGSANVSGTFEWINGATKPDVAGNVPFGVRFTPADITNYNTVVGSVTLTVTKANVDFALDHPQVTATYTAGLTLAGIPLNAGYKWATGNTPVSARDSWQEIDAVYNDPSGNYNEAKVKIWLMVNRAVVDMRAILGVIPPATGGRPVEAIPKTTQYAGTVRWYPQAPYFKPAQKYIADIVLEVDSNYTLQGVRSNFFTVAGASGVSNSANSGIVTAEFPETGPPSEITIAGPQALTVIRKGGAATLSVSAGASPSAALSYRWYKCVDVDINYGIQLIQGATGASYTVLGTQPGTYYYCCEVVAATGGVVSAPAYSTVATVAVRDIPSAADLDYTMTPVIPYDGSPHPVAVESNKFGLGEITAVRYNGGTGVPVNAGTYAVTVDIAEGTVYDAETVSLGSYTISRARVTVDPANSSVASKEYDGTTGAAVTSVAFSGVYQAFVMGEDYTVSGAVFDNANAGNRSVTAFVALVDNAKTVNYTLAGNNFLKPGVVISKKTLVADDFVLEFPDAGRRENGKPQPIDDYVSPSPKLLGLGAITVLYDGLPASASHPVGAKAYAVSVDVAEGLNYNAAHGLAIGVYRIWSDIESISRAEVRVLKEYVYSGSPRVPEAENVAVTLDGVTLKPGVDYAVAGADNNVSVGTARVYVAGRGSFTDTARGEFAIAKKRPELSDLSYSPQYAVYNADTQRVTVTAAPGVVGLGDVATSYARGGVEVQPVNAGAYDVFADIAEGANYTALKSLKLGGAYTIRKKPPKMDDVVFSIPTNHYYTGRPQGIGPVTLKGTGYGTVTLLYNDSAALPVEAGTYILYLAVSGGDNYLPEAGTIGEYVIAAERASAQTPERVIPGGAGAGAVVAPVNLPATEFTAGPNPAAKSRGAVNFFRQGKWVMDGELAVYDASGNVVNKINIRDRIAAGNSGRRAVGSWDLSDASGRPVAEGTYLVRGVITAADGQRERVFIIIGLR